MIRYTPNNDRIVQELIIFPERMGRKRSPVRGSFVGR